MFILETLASHNLVCRGPGANVYDGSSVHITQPEPSIGKVQSCFVIPQRSLLAQLSSHVPLYIFVRRGDGRHQERCQLR